MKKILLTMAVSLALLRPALAQTPDAGSGSSQPLPTMDFLLQKVIARATNVEDNNDSLFAMNYQYQRTRTWEYRNGSGVLTGTNQTSRLENKPEQLAARAARMAASANQSKPSAETGKTMIIPGTHTSVQAKDLKVKTYSIPNLAARFRFTLVGREILNGRPSLVVDFQPLNDHLPVNQFVDNFINRTAGRVWIDEGDYAIARAQLHLTQPVSVLGGLVGTLSKFTCQFTRVRTPEGYWFARNMDWHLEGREVVVNRVVDYHERKFDEQKIPMTATAR